MGKIPRQEQQNEAGLCQEQDRRGRKQLQSRKASEKETVGTRRSGQCPGEASETGRAASLIPVLDEQKDCCWCLPYILRYVCSHMFSETQVTLQEGLLRDRPRFKPRQY